MLYADSEIPQGVLRCPPYSICLLTVAREVCQISVFSYVGITRLGIRYSNIDPLQERSTGSLPAFVRRRLRANQLSCGNLPWAIPVKIPNLTSEASRS